MRRLFLSSNLYKKCLQSVTELAMFFQFFLGSGYTVQIERTFKENSKARKIASGSEQALDTLNETKKETCLDKRKKNQEYFEK